MKYLALLVLMISLPARAEEQCREDSLVHFFSHGQEVSSEVVGASDPCDDFGGNLVHTPGHHIFVYVNFNIEGAIDLDQIDAISVPSLRKIDLVLVKKDWIKRVYNVDAEAVLNFAGNTLFISEVVLAEGRLMPLLKDFYDSEGKTARHR